MAKGEGMSILAEDTVIFDCDECFANVRDIPATGECMSFSLIDSQ